MLGISLYDPQGANGYSIIQTWYANGCLAPDLINIYGGFGNLTEAEDYVSDVIADLKNKPHFVSEKTSTHHSGKMGVHILKFEGGVYQFDVLPSINPTKR